MLKKLVVLMLVGNLFAACGNRRQSVYLLTEQVKTLQVVAVLPFENLTDDDAASEVVTGLFASELAKVGKFKILEAGEVRRRLQEKQKTLPAAMDSRKAQELAGILGVDAVFSGAVLEFAYLRDVREGEVIAREPVVGLQARLFDARKGRLIWSVVHSRSGGSLVLTNQETIQNTAIGAIDAMLQTLK